MIPALNFFSGLGAMSENSNFFSNSFPNLVDYNWWKIVSIIATYGMDINDVKVPTFQMLYRKDKKKWNAVIQWPRPDANAQATIAALYAWYQTNVPGMEMTLYTNLICLDKINVVNPNILPGGTQTSVIINDTMVDSKVFDPNWVQPNCDPENLIITPATHIKVYTGNEADYTFYTVLGDQTFAGNGYYGVY